MAETDVKDTDSPSESDSKALADKDSSKIIPPGSGDTGSLDDELDGEADGKGPVPYKRFEQVNSRLKETASGLRWYQDNIGSPDDVIAYRQWKADQEAKKSSDAGAKPYTQEETRKVRELVMDSVPELKEFMTAKQEREEAMFDLAEDEIRALAQEHEMPKDEKFLIRLGRQILVEIEQDPKLLRLWKSGNVKAVRQAFEAVNESFLGYKKKQAVEIGKAVAEKRRMSRIPSVPPGKPAVSHQKDPLKGQGLTKAVHDAAWERMKAHME